MKNDEFTLSAMEEALWHSALICMWILDEEGCVRAVNPATGARLGVDPAHLQGRHVLQLAAQGNREALAARLAECHPGSSAFLLNLMGSASSPVTFSCRLQPREGGGLLLMAEPLLEADNSHQEELAHQNREISRLHRDLARSERDLRRANTRLEQTLTELRHTQAMLVHNEKMAALGRVTAGVAHEVNNPLGWVINNQATLKRAFDDLLGFVNQVGVGLDDICVGLPAVGDRLIEAAEEAQLDYLATSIPRTLERNAEGLERVRQIVADLRTFSRLDEADLKVCDLRQDLQATLRFLSLLQREHGVEVETQLEYLPLLLCRPGALNQAISAVITNAIQASPPGAKVILRARQVEAGIEIVVHDQGSGIAPENLPHIFDPFFTTKGPGGGTGLGLSVAHQVFLAHHAQVEVESQPAHGTTFTILLPPGASP